MSEKMIKENKLSNWTMALLPLVLLGGLVLLFINTNPIQVSTADLPPIEILDVEFIDLPEPNRMEVHVINAGPDPIEIAQVLVDEAYWQFTIEPGSRLERLERAVITLNYPWIETEPHEIVILTSSGTTFSGTVEISVETPAPGLEQLLAYALVGVYVGIIPVGLGLLWYPSMQRLDRKSMGFVLALTIGLLVFLLIDTFLEALEVAALLPEVYQGVSLAVFAALLTWLAITAIGGRKSVQDRNSTEGRKFVALLIAVGIGFHNLGEGLVVGAAFALGEASLGSFLVIGFILHNITEGVGIVAPVTKDSPRLRWFLLVLLIAGGPAILGTLIGGFAFTPLLGVLFLGIGIGAIWQVVYEVSLLLQRYAEKDKTSAVTWLNVAGLFVGIAIMYITAFLVKF